MVTEDSLAWWRVIETVADTLDGAGIPYSFDASASVFVHGLEFAMDDVDVMVDATHFPAARETFLRYGPTPITVASFSHFHFYIDGRKVHILTRESITDLSTDRDRVSMLRTGRTLWSKSIGF